MREAPVKRKPSIIFGGTSSREAFIKQNEIPQISVATNIANFAFKETDIFFIYFTVFLKIW